MASGIERAKANAVYFGCEYVVFCDTSSNWQVERASSGPKQVRRYLVKPDGTITELEAGETPPPA